MTDAEFELELVEALNMLLEDERASVEMEVALASGATEYAERDTLAAMGAEDIHFCVQLREEMEDAGLPVTPQINGVVFEVVGAERYDDRLRAFAHHQRVVADRARELQESNLEGALRAALDGISISHDLHADWIERRAAEFAATRTLEFGANASALEAHEAVPEPTEPIEPIELTGPTEPALADQPDAEAATLTTEPAEVPVVEPEPATEASTEPAPEEPAAPQAETPKPRARATSRPTTRSTTARSAKPGATRAKTTKTTKATKATTKKADATPKTPTRRPRRAPADTPPDEA